MTLRIIQDAGDAEREFRAAILKERRDAIEAGKTFAAACMSSDVAGFYRAVDQIGETVDGWRHAAIGVSRLRGVAPGIRDAFLSVWIESKMLPLMVGDRKAMAGALRVLMLPAHQGEPIHLYRGASAKERRSATYGFSWSTDFATARTFAEHWRKSEAGGVLLETIAPATAVLLRREIEGYYDEGEVVVDPYRLDRVKLVERLPPVR
ncbi:hypothetical protein MesoLj131c_47010 [Mesorhizobium sp. 131-3-5]|uniref:hypothetical protein n=1 Tax=Mesorhizobium sp. 131-3-5 TaxID=2744520 RepID=UPI001925630E|nr:hypothetical protein [Mesorhizobium sp. 131-3-5]BCH10443.1 hypothetical protein MesoLj131c_47010 [Mesorhizobium sp. 131-3-5]